MRHYILNTGVDALTKQEALQKADALIVSGAFHFIVTPNPEIVLYAHKNPEFRAILNKSSLALCDGMGIYMAGKILGKPFPERICGVDFMQDLCALAQKRGYRVRLFGAKENVRERTEQVLRSMFPRLVFSDIAEITFIALGAPKQEYEIYSRYIKGARGVYMGVGGAFDMIAGVLPRAPFLMRAAGLEWFWRLFLEPSRAGRIWRAVVVFPLAILFGAIRT